MSQPSSTGVPPEFQPPPSYGGYGGDLQSYGQQGYRQQGYRGAPYAAPSVHIGQPVLSPLPAAEARPLAAPARLAPPQRPAVVGLAATLASTAALQWVCALSLCWLVATAGVAQLGTTGVDGGVYHTLNRISYRLSAGLAWPLYLFPLASFVLSFLLLTGQRWARLAFTATGAAALLWSGWWLRDDLIWWLVPAFYIAVSTLVLWTADANRWFRWRSASDQAGQLP